MKRVARLPGGSLAGERRAAPARIESLLAVQREVTLVLASAASLRAGAPKILAELCCLLGWDWGAIWRVQGKGAELACRESHKRSSAGLASFEAASREARASAGDGAVGRVWQSGAYLVAQDFAARPPGPDWGARYQVGATEGLRTAVCFPIESGGAVIGVLELASFEPQRADGATIQLLVAVCSQIGQFVERKRAFDDVARHGQEVERQKAFVEQIIGMVPAGIAYIDRQLHVRWANPQLARLLKRPGASLVGKHVREVFADGRVRRTAQRVLHRGGTQRLIGIAPAWAGEGAGIFCDVVVSTAAAGESGGDGLLIFVTDATERAKADRVLQQQMAEYAKIDRLKTDFLNATSHELRTPLSIILGYAEFLEDQIGGPLTGEQAEFVGAISQAGRTLRLLVDDMLDFARLEAGQFVLERRGVDMRGLIRGVVQHMDSLADHQDVRVILELPDEPVRVEMDSFRIGRVIRNLVSNAIKFNRPGGDVAIALSATSRSVRVEVRDTGIGIPAAYRARIFEKFYQVDASATRQRGGAGLGLSVAKALVLAHRGKLGFSSEAGCGSTFWFTLPRGARPADRDAELAD
ncbi:MAG: GAF domain-containing sensor histidine kinase [Candidatus Sericytochromatia bacterium]|nr:GAF domain-containing sensor histidine kinase [Candidatus Tanganyikabacteria bacterium]